MKKYLTSKIGKISLLAILPFVMFVLAFVLFDKTEIRAFATSSEQNYLIENVLSSGEFEDDNFVVVLDKGVSGINKIHNKNFFKGIDVASIVDLTKREMKIDNSDGFEQILQVFLKNSNKEKVLRSIAIASTLKGIKSAEPNYVVELNQTPNDPELASTGLWGLTGTNGINAKAAWDISQGSKNVRVGVIDTGIANHEDLDANLVSGWDTYNNNAITNDDTHSHGTHVAGTIGAVGNNGIGVVGVNWNVSLVPLQAANIENRFSSSDVIKAIEWAEDKWGTSEQIDILNYSVGGFGETTAVKNAVKNYHGLFVWAAGNDAADVDSKTNATDFNLPNLISVGALDSTGDRRSTSNYGTETVNVYAPGGNIYSTVPGGYDNMSGTSMAAPHVAGVAALILSVEPSLTATRIKDIILSTADTLTINTPSGSQSVKKIERIQSFRLC